MARSFVLALALHLVLGACSTARPIAPPQAANSTPPATPAASPPPAAPAASTPPIRRVAAEPAPAPPCEVPRFLDLTRAPLLTPGPPPWEATPSARTPASAPPKLVKIAGRTSDPVRALDPEFSAARPWFIAPVLRGAVPHGARADIPSSYAGEDLRAIIPNAEKLLLVYGGRYLVIVNGATPERALDLEAFRHPPKATPRWQQFAHQDVTFAQERDGVLYVCNGGGSYAREVYGKKGFLSAIDSATGKLLWRSAPLTCNATFAMLPEYLITGYGFTAEPDYVFLVRRSDGAIVQRLRLPTGPDTIELVGDRVRVETYDHTLDFELR